MVKKLRRRCQLGKVRPGDGSTLADAKTKKQHHAATGRSPAALYRDGVQVPVLRPSP